MLPIAPRRPRKTLFDKVLYFRSADAKVTYLTEFELNRAQAEGDQPIILQNERLNALKQQPQQQQKKKSTYITDGGHTTDSSSSSEKAATPIVTHKRTPVEEQHYQRLTQQRSVVVALTNS